MKFLDTSFRKAESSAFGAAHAMLAAVMVFCALWLGMVGLAQAQESTDAGVVTDVEAVAETAVETATDVEAEAVDVVEEEPADFLHKSDLPLLQRVLPVLSEGNYSDKMKAVDVIAADSNRDLVLGIMQPMLAGDLYVTEDGKQLWSVQSKTESADGEETFSIAPLQGDGVLGAAQTVSSMDDYSKVRVNNRLRGKLRRSIAGLMLADADAGVRRQAVEDLLKKPTEDNLKTIAEARANEKDADVAGLMDVGLAVGDLQGSDDAAKVAAAIATLGKSIEPVALNSLRVFAEDTEDSALKAQAEKAIQTIEGKHAWYSRGETVFFGLSLGSVLVLSAIGLAITFGVMGVINMAHGELMMLGAYTTFVVQQLMPEMLGLSILVSIPAAFLVAALVGIVMERLVIRHLYGRPLETLLATFGISLILQQAVRSIFSPLNRTVVTPEWMSGIWQINSVFALTWNRIYIIVFCLIVFFALLMLMKRSSLGLHVRAVAQNRTMARAMGVRSTRVDILTFGLGSGIAGIAGVALSLLTNVGPNLGQSYIIDSFMVVVFGGVGNLWGTLIAGLSLGVLNKVMEPWAGAVLAKILMLVFIILFIQKRPQGLFPQRGRAAEG